MYKGFFGAGESAFSLTPDPRYFYRSPGHKEALEHLQYGILAGGSFILLTGEVGTGKTSACRYQINHLPANVQVALILNPRLTEVELLATICDELYVAYPAGTTSLKVLVDCLNGHLLDAHAAGQQVVVIIDEAQNLRPEVLEGVRLLTNLQTDTDMLLQIILIGQPELTELLGRQEMRQLNQRITGRYHLTPLTAAETEAYIRHRLMVGGLAPDLFTPEAIGEIHRRAGGVPRVINRICDCCLLGLHVEEVDCVDQTLARTAIKEVLGEHPARLGDRLLQQRGKIAAAAAAVFFLALLPVTVETVSGIFGGTDPVASIAAAAPQQAVADPNAAQRLAIRESAQRTTAVAQTPLPAAYGAARDRTPSKEPGEVLRLGSMTPLFQVKSLAAGRETALTVLFQPWRGVPAGLRGDGACEAAAAEGLACLEVPAGSWDLLAEHNRPALIAFVRPDGRKVHAVAAELIENEVTLLFGNLRVRMARDILTPFWSDPALVLWQPGASTGKPQPDPPKS